MKTLSWDEMYLQAKLYYQEYGNLLAPAKYVTADGIKLGYWISRQRKEYKTNYLSSERISLLEDIGMIWSIYDVNWYENYDLARQYYMQNGNLFIPLLYTTNRGVKLGSWIGKQRKQYKERFI